MRNALDILPTSWSATTTTNARWWAAGRAAKARWPSIRHSAQAAISSICQIAGCSPVWLLLPGQSRASGKACSVTHQFLRAISPASSSRPDCFPLSRGPPTPSSTFTHRGVSLPRASQLGNVSGKIDLRSGAWRSPYFLSARLSPLMLEAVEPVRGLEFSPRDLPPRVVPHPMLVPAPVEGREGRASSGTRATA